MEEIKIEETDGSELVQIELMDLSYFVKIAVRYLEIRGVSVEFDEVLNDAELEQVARDLLDRY